MSQPIKYNAKSTG